MYGNRVRNGYPLCREGICTDIVLTNKNQDRSNDNHSNEVALDHQEGQLHVYPRVVLLACTPIAYSVAVLLDARTRRQEKEVTKMEL